MKKYFLAFFLFIICFNSFAAHTKGGWMYYEYLGPGIADPTKLRYKIVLNVYMICGASSAQIDNPLNLTFFDGGTNAFLETVSVPLAAQPNVSNCPTQTCHPCIANPPAICYKIATYETIKELAATPNGYTISYQRCCRIMNISNLQPPTENLGDTWTIKIPGTQNLASGPQNSSPKFIPNDTAMICADNFFTLDFTATDADGDQLLYSFGPAYTSQQTPPNPATAAAPPYNAVPYRFPFSFLQPLGSGVTINANTGIVSGTAPSSGEYVITVVIYEYRNGVYLGESRKSVHITVASCVPIIANLNPEYITCDGFTMSFSNNAASSAISDYFWDFGVPGTVTDTSILATPTFTYPDTGVYQLTLIVNRGGQCTDTAKALVRVYPGFFPGFKWVGQCRNTPILFSDTSKTLYGIVDTWSWNFGDPLTLADTSHFRGPTYTFPNPGTYDVSLIVTNSKGCTKSINQPVTIIDNPQVDMSFRDTSFCGLDTIQLHATANFGGNFSWTPLTNIIGANTADPLVFPNTTTIYRVSFDAGGCTDTDSVIVRPKFDLNTTANSSVSNICEEDTLNLSALSNHAPISYTWSPAASIESPFSQTTRAYPSATTTYTVLARWGNNCVDTHTRSIIVKPLAVANAGPDDAFCPGAAGVVLNASGGNSYLWSPPLGLSSIGIPNPLAKPDTTTTYTVSVGVTGCSKRRLDSVIVTVRTMPALQLTNDTLICSIDTLQLNSIGTGTILWTPNYNINNQNSANPLVSPDVPTTYYATITDGIGCSKQDSVYVNVKLTVTIDAGNDTSICRTDPVRLNTASDALHYLWTPSVTLNSDTAKNPIATPAATTTFKVIGNIGKCQSVDSVTVKVVPYPVAAATPDTTICFGNSIQLFASGGSIYTWSPAIFLNNANIPNPISSTGNNIRYTVTVRDTLGCPKPVTASTLVTVYPRITADAGPRDTNVVINQPLQLQGSGGPIYLWTPATGLSDANISNPVARVQNTQDYVLTVSSAAGCADTDTITVTVYKVLPQLFVPNAFTPNGDGLNDIFRPIPIGMKAITYFKVYNRWGQLMFETSEQGKGWDGKRNGIVQNSAVFVWIVEGVDYQDNIIRQKGTVTLIK